jgi:hypothetical protein
MPHIREYSGKLDPTTIRIFQGDIRDFPDAARLGSQAVGALARGAEPTGKLARVTQQGENELINQSQCARIDCGLLGDDIPRGGGRERLAEGVVKAVSGCLPKMTVSKLAH